MNAEEIYEIAKRIEQLRGSYAIVSFRYTNFSEPCMSVHATGSGLQITEICGCKMVESCVQIRDFDTCIKVLDKIIQQAKNN